MNILLNPEITTGYEIPNGEILFRYCLPAAFPEGQNDIPASIFTDGELSCDWERIQHTPKESYQYKTCGKTMIIAIKVCDEIKNPTNPKNSGKVEPTWKQNIYYDPVLEESVLGGKNLAHSVIKGKKKPAVMDIIRNNSSIYE